MRVNLCLQGIKLTAPLFLFLLDHVIHEAVDLIHVAVQRTAQLLYFTGAVGIYTGRNIADALHIGNGIIETDQRPGDTVSQSTVDQNHDHNGQRENHDDQASGTAGINGKSTGGNHADKLPAGVGNSINVNNTPAAVEDFLMGAILFFQNIPSILLIVICLNL